MDKLPKGWVDCKLGDVVAYGKTTKADISSVSDTTWVLELEDIEKESSKILKRVSFADRQSKSAKNCFSEGDVLYGKLRPYLNKIIIADQDGICSSEIIPLKVDSDQLNNHYVFHWLKSRYFLGYVDSVSYGVNMPRLGTKDGVNAPFRLAPLKEQTRIAEKLNDLLGQVDTIQTRLDRLPDIIKRFRQSVLAAAVSGQLTEEWRRSQPLVPSDPAGNADGSLSSDGADLSGKTADIPSEDAGNEGQISDKKTLLGKEVPIEWDVQAAAKVCLRVQSGSTPRNNPFEQNGNIPFLKVYNIVDQGINFSYKPQYITEEVSEKSKRSACLPGDVLMNIVGPPLGKVAIVTNQFEKWHINQAITLFRADPQKLLVKYLYFMLCEGELVRKVMPDTKGSVGQVNISLTQCREALLPIPAMDEQKEIVRVVEKYFALADTLETNLTKARERVAQLTQSILAKAFRGELLPQDENDEPADQLLARIAAARAEAEKLEKATKKATRTRKAKTASAV